MIILKVIVYALAGLWIAEFIVGAALLWYGVNVFDYKKNEEEEEQ